MPLKKEPCRNFQRGNCRFGDRCKFLHVTQQQPKSNGFGFGSQTATPFQQQKPNPFGFGVQNSGPTSGAPFSGGHGHFNSSKPFENKWTRSEQPTSQSQAASHNCTDPDSCKRQFVEDYQHERPLWKLTCYGHYKYLPCDITGDVSFEELRAVAYDDAKRGTSLPSIVERERSLVNSKSSEYDKLLQNPYTKNATPPAQLNQSPFPALGVNSPSPIPQNSGPSLFSTSSQQNPSPNLSFGVRPSTPPNSGFGQFQGHPGPAGSNIFPSGSFGTQAPTQTGGNLLAGNVGGFGNSGMNSQGTQFPVQTGGNTFTPNAGGVSNIGVSSQGPQVPVQTSGVPYTSFVGGFAMRSQGSQLPSTSSVSLNTQISAVNNSSMLFNGLGGSNAVQQTIDNNPQGASATDASIWLKEEWKLGEIPEQPPPEAYVR